MEPVNNTMGCDFYLKRCFKEYMLNIEDHINQGNNITLLTKDQLYERCNSTLPNNCTVTKGKPDLTQKM